ncbi:endonuclease V [Mucor mucedo]|uniref:endonuclease V n=1 Tax=Mucor mucedo TaxID=29922 RepID=UPI00221F241D|nr:endonuclease V [Mucor mucedo]KAI7896959.1 endonuclease V [Mucor mucedo]
MLDMGSTYDADPSNEQRNKWQDEQNKLRQQHEMYDMLDFDPKTLDGLNYIAGVDLSFPLGDNENAVACLIVMSMPELKVVYKKFLETKLYLPYISGYLAFREVGPLLKLLDELKIEHPELYPQMILVDGNGLLHPRQFGIASHLGVLSNTPTIGIAKTFLMIPDDLDDLLQVKTKYKKELLKKGDAMDLIGNKSKIIYGTALRTSDSAPNPVFVSQGHRVSLQTSVKVVLATCPKYRIPEPIRAADLESRAYIREQPSK